MDNRPYRTAQWVAVVVAISAMFVAFKGATGANGYPVLASAILAILALTTVVALELRTREARRRLVASIPDAVEPFQNPELLFKFIAFMAAGTLVTKYVAPDIPTDQGSGEVLWFFGGCWGIALVDIVATALRGHIGKRK